MGVDIIRSLGISIQDTDTGWVAKDARESSEYKTRIIRRNISTMIKILNKYLCKSVKNQNGG